VNNKYSVSEFSCKPLNEVPPTAKLPVPNQEILKRLNILKQLDTLHWRRPCYWSGLSPWRLRFNLRPVYV